MKGHGRKSIAPTTRKPTARQASATPSYPKHSSRPKARSPKLHMRTKGLR